MAAPAGPAGGEDLASWPASGPADRGALAFASRVARLAGAPVRELRALGAQHGSGHYRVTLADGRVAFAKVQVQAPGGVPADAPAGVPADAPGGVFEAEARGLRWLAETGTVAVPQVIGWDPATLLVAWIAEQEPGQRAAEQFGRDLAALHTAGADRFGAPWPGFIASLPLGDGTGDAGSVCAVWPDWYGSQRLLPYLRRGADAGVLTSADTRLVEAVIGRLGELAGPAEPPSRIHGDCWSGNVLWSAGRAWLIDPAAQGGHREADLAMLALFGAPYLDRVVACYQEAAPLADGWRARVPLHQLHPLLVHVCLFGAGYRSAVLDAARAALAA
jgi:fructosamine-3-kinase